MAEPSLSEIANLKVDPELATGNAPVIYDSREMVRNLNQAAQYKSENDYRKYNVFLNNVNSLYKDLGEVMSQPVLTNDREELQKQAADIYSNIFKNPRDFFGGGAKMAEIQAKLGKLQSDVVESKQNRIYDFAHREYVNRNPELNTDENKQFINGYLSQPLGKRQPYILNFADQYDPNKLSEELNKIARNETPFNKVTPDNQFIESGTIIKYTPEKYDKLAEQMYYYPNERGVPIKNVWERRFEKLPDEIKDKFRQVDPNDPAKAAYLEDIRARRRGETIEGYKMQVNPKYISPLDTYKAQTSRISANAAAQKAAVYSSLQNKKLKDLNDNEKRVKGFWDGVVDRVSDTNGQDILNIANLPEGYTYMAGVDKEGKPIKLKPIVATDGSKYYGTKYTSAGDGNAVDKQFISDKFKDYQTAGGKGDYNSYLRNLIKKGVIDLELVGANGTADFNSALQSARALSNKVGSGKEEPVYSETETIIEE